MIDTGFFKPLHTDSIKVFSGEERDAFGSVESQDEKLFETEGNLQVSGRTVNSIQHRHEEADAVFFCSCDIPSTVQPEHRVRVASDHDTFTGQIVTVRRIDNALVLKLQ
jgi:hypothetical protein